MAVDMLLASAYVMGLDSWNPLGEPSSSEHDNVSHLCAFPAFLNYSPDAIQPDPRLNFGYQY